ncbi:hypothetical protein PIIN_06041 [Serendipita indica DSM 11827]|uniref:F-box domain-containing protein n=1 Tax=Serendipita indica (strain DSM 11827) TaxID=1109443 RepID=G4TLB2_SERID|nr:hypothetical protein PIIN_06041 [Serendipita indica DSM 11827]
MPVEILAMILDEYHLMDLPLTLLMTVCRALNEVIKNTPRLWRRILISLDSMPPSLKAGSTMACATEKFLQTCIQRAHNSPLEATFVVGRIDESSPTPEFRRARFHMLMSRSSQISFLCLIINPDTPLHIIKNSFHGLFNDSTAFPALESLMIASAFPVPGLLEVFHPLLDQLERTTVKLRSVYFENVTREFILAAREYRFWRKLRRVTIKGEYSPIHVTAFEGCDDLEFLSISSELLVHPSCALNPPLRGGPLGIPEFSEMEVDAGSKCESQYLPVHPEPKVPLTVPDSSKMEVDAGSGYEGQYLPVHPERKVPLTKVQWLRVGAIAMSGLQELQIPNVKFLVIQSALPDSARQEPVPAHSIRLPNLQVFHVAASHSEITAISAPELHTLCLQVSVLKRADADRVVSSIFHGGEGMWTPKTLSINAPIHDKHYETLYRRLPDLETLTVTLADKPSETFYKTLKKRGILPHLLRLTLDFYALPTPTSANGASTSTPQMRTVRYGPLTEGELALSGSYKLWRGGGGAMSTLLGGKSAPHPLSEQVRPAMREVARVRSNQRLEFALLACKYGAEHLEEIYAEKNICNTCRKSAYLNGTVGPTSKHPNGAHTNTKMDARGATHANGNDHSATAS